VTVAPACNIPSFTIIGATRQYHVQLHEGLLDWAVLPQAEIDAEIDAEINSFILSIPMYLQTQLALLDYRDCSDYSRAQKDYCKVIDVLAASIAEKVVKGVVCDDKTWFLVPRTCKR
jgi:hypothetical protein